MANQLLDKYYKISEALDDDILLVALALRTIGAKEPVNYLYERLIKVNLEKSEKHLTTLYHLILDTTTHEGIKKMLILTKIEYLLKEPDRLTYTKDDFIN